jgi:2-oxoglutarate ferredoxin oxidoreductase subunit delta
MGVLKAPANTPVWVKEERCKACDICVSVCPAGVLAMVPDPSSTLGAMVKVLHPESCIGCQDCELNCPDFAIFVSTKEEYKFAKLTEEAKARQEAIVKNQYRSVG